MTDMSAAVRLVQQLLRQTNLDVTVGETAGVITLTGTVDSAEARAMAAQTVAEALPGRRIENQLAVAAVPPPEVESAVYSDAGQPPDGYTATGDVPLDRAGSDLNPSFTDQPLETNAINVVDEDVFDADLPAEPEPTYFAPTDPVITTDEQGGPQVLGGFEPTSTTTVEVARSAEDNLPGDEALAEAIRRELREDASTTALDIEVTVDRGVAYLRGTVADLADVENVEAVANEVPGVIEVDEQLDISGL